MIMIWIINGLKLLYKYRETKRLADEMFLFFVKRDQKGKEKFCKRLKSDVKWVLNKINAKVIIYKNKTFE